MSSESRKETLSVVKEALNNLQKARGLVPRSSQNQMISNIAVTLFDRAEHEPNGGSNIIAIEAPTGTGKSFGYLLPAIPIAKSLEKKVVVSTAVVSLQEQLIKQDLPAMTNALPIKFTYALAKGRSRFVCASRLNSQKAAFEELGFKDDGSFSVGADSTQTEDALFVMRMHAEYESQKWNGEQETLTFGTEKQKKSVWPKIITDSGGCGAKNCASYSKCAYYAAKKIWMEADVVVANHDLVMSDLSTPSGGGALLPKPEDTIYIFDEAHHIPMKARDAFSSTFKTETFKKLPKEIATFYNSLITEWKDESCSKCKNIATTLNNDKKKYQDEIKEFSTQYEEFIESIKKITEKSTPTNPYILPYKDEHIDYAVMKITEPLIEKSQAIFNRISATFDNLMDSKKTLFKAMNSGFKTDSPILDDSVLNRVAGALGFYKSRYANLLATLSFLIKEQPPVESPPYAKWITPNEKLKNEYSVSASPTMATDILPTFLFEKAYSVIFASATLTAVGGFDLFKQKTGMIHYPNCRTLKLDSPFDFKKNATLAFGDMGGTPQDTEHHTRRLHETIPQLLQDYPELGTLILFTSKFQMENVMNKLPFDIRSKCKIQYELPNNILIKQHKEDIDNGIPSILVGTMSFSEGLDLPGAWCGLVIITKLPFSVPDNPIDKTLAVWLESQGRNVFKEIAVPEASERLIQQAGRLIRRESDTGTVIMLDNRLMTKWNAYGKLLVEALPPFRRKRIDLTKTVYKEKHSSLPNQNKSGINSKSKGIIPELYESSLDEDNEFKDFIF